MREISPNCWRRLMKLGGARHLSSNHRTQERPSYASARNGSRVLLRCERPVQLQTGRTYRERARLFIPRNTPHTFQNIGTEPGVLLFGVTPGGFEKMFAERQGVDADTNQKLMAKHHMQVGFGTPLR